jgi:anti-sigma factor RsiW
MTCDAVRGILEELAAGEASASPEVASHLAGCPACSAEMMLATRIEQALSTSPRPAAPQGFADAVMRRVRRDRWRSEQFLDIGFNVAVAVSLLLVVGGVWLLLNLTGLAAVTTGAVRVLAGGFRELTGRIAPSLSIYFSALAVALTAGAIWWWTERGWSV